MRTAPSAGLQPRPHQVQALDAAERAYAAGASRVQWRMACGAGKTLASMWLAQRLGARTVIVFAPSIALVAQTLAVWNRGGLPVRALAVCSDPTTAAGRSEIGVDGVSPWSGREIAGVVTMRADVVARFLDGAEAAPDGVISVVVATYQSCAVVGAALELADRVGRADLLIADEAHHLVSAPAYAPVLEERGIRARRRLFQTATAVVDPGYVASRFDQWSGAAARLGMDDERLFGPTVFTVSVGEAIAANLLADYRVLVTAKAADGGVDAGDPAALAALVEAARRYGVRRILSFHNRVAGAHEFAGRVNEIGDVDGTAVRAAAVDGTMSAADRQKALGLLEDNDPAITVICSAQCLREGIDIPGVDAVLFANPRTSSVGIVQAVGRALRLHPAKSLGHIIIPVVLDEDSDDHEQLSASSYQHVWRVLRGLAAHDERVAYDLQRGGGRRIVGGMEVPSWLDVGGDLTAMVVSRLLRHTSLAWESRYQQLCEVVEQVGSAAHITAAVDQDAAAWMQLQRKLHRRGDLDRHRVERLQELAGWWWDARAAADERSLAALDAVIAARGSLQENPAGPSIYRGYKDGRGKPLATWVGTQLCRYRSGDLPQWLHEELDARPGWTWTPLAAADEAGFEAFRSFCAWEGHGDIPADAVEGDVALGDWVADVRRRRVLDTLSPALESMITAATPIDKSGRRLFWWDRNGAWWSLNMAAAHQYVARTGTLHGMPGSHKELIDGKPVAVWQWLSRIRHEHLTKEPLPADKVAQLEALPGFVWKVQVPVAERVTPGSPRACTEPGCDRLRSRRGLCNVHYQTAAADQKARGQWEAVYVDAEPVRLHIKELQAAGLGLRRIAELAGVNRKTLQWITTGRSERGSTPSAQVHRDNAAKILAVDLPATPHGSAAAGQLVAARGSVRRLQALVAAGHPRSALAARLGISPGNATRLFDEATEQVTAATARKIATVFEELKTVPGPSSRSVNDGRRNHWPLPADLDLEHLDQARISR